MTQSELEALIDIVPTELSSGDRQSLDSLEATLRNLVNEARFTRAATVAKILERVPAPYRIDRPEPMTALRDTVTHLVDMVNKLARPEPPANAQLGVATAHRDTILSNIPNGFVVSVKNDAGDEDKWASLSVSVAKLIADVKAKRAQTETIIQLCQITKASSLSDLTDRVAVAVSENTTAQKEFQELFESIPGKWRVTVNSEPALGVTINTLVKRLEAATGEPDIAERIYDEMKHGPGTAAREEYVRDMPATERAIAASKVKNSRTTELHDRLIFWDRQAEVLNNDGRGIPCPERVELVTRMAESIASTIRLHANVVLQARDIEARMKQ